MTNIHAFKSSEHACVEIVKFADRAMYEAKKYKNEFPLDPFKRVQIYQEINVREN